MRLALIVTAAIALATGCASPGMPPGGPTVSAFPRVIASLPETSTVNARPNKVLLRYDDVIGEQANGFDLNRSVLISPWDGLPRVEWKRTGMTIRPHNGWRTNTAYTITVLPGVSDFRGKASPYGYEFRFSTGPAIPKTIVRGVAFDWVQARAIPKATIQAIDPTDSTLVWLTVADSAGRYEIGAMPVGKYIIRAIDEKAPNRVLDSREAWDTATVTVADSARADLYVFIHDTLPIRITELRLNDSVTINLTLDKPLKPGVAIPVSAARVVMSDSTEVPIASLRTARQEQAERARTDSIARAKDTTAVKRDTSTTPRRSIDPNRRRDTVPVIPPPVAKREAPATELVIHVSTPLKPGSTYRVTLKELRNLLGVPGTATHLLIVPKPTPVDSTRNGLPGARRPGGRDSTGRPITPGDSVKPAPAPAKPPARPPR